MQVIAAPTGSGKTVVLELAVLRMLSGSINKQGLFSHRRGSLRAVYLAPSKALVQVTMTCWQSTEKSHSYSEQGDQAVNGCSGENQGVATEVWNTSEPSGC